MKPEFIELPKGDCIRTDSIVAVRLLNESPKEKEVFIHQLKPRVAIDYHFGGTAGHRLVLTFKTTYERDEVAAAIRAKLTH